MKSFSPSIAAMMVVVWVSAAAPRSAAAAPQAPQSTSAPTLMRLDGELKTPTGEPRTGTVLLVASVYATQDASTPVWFEQQGVTLDAVGRYTIVVGATLDDGMPKELFLAGSGRWLGIAVQGEAEQPRIMLVTVPYALKAREADTLAGRLFSDFVLSDQLKDSVKAVLNADQADGSTPGILGTTNRVVKFDGSGNATADSSIFDNGNIGIGTTSPGALLHVQGAGLAAPRLTSSDGLGDARWGFFNGAAFRGAVGWDQSSNVMGIYGAGNSGSPVISIVGASGNVGVGTTNPGAVLHVEREGVAAPRLTSSDGLGDARWAFFSGTAFRGAVGWDQSSNVMGIYGAGTSGSPVISIVGASGNVGIGTTSPGAVLHVEREGQAAPRLTSSDGLGDARWAFFSGTSFRGAVGWDQSSNVMGIYGAATSATPAISIDGASGNVGVGTTAPVEKLDVVGSINVSGNINAKYQDVAEWVETARRLDAGTVVIVDPLESNHVLPATRAYDTRVAGAVSRQPGLLLGERSDTKAMVAQSGRVRVKVDAKYGAIRIGDLLVTSPTPGHAMRSRPMRLAGGQSLHRPGTLVGKALERPLQEVKGRSSYSLRCNNVPGAPGAAACAECQVFQYGSSLPT